MKKEILSAVLAGSMVLTMAPTAFAAGEQPDNEELLIEPYEIPAVSLSNAETKQADENTAGVEDSKQEKNDEDSLVLNGESAPASDNRSDESVEQKEVTGSSENAGETSGISTQDALKTALTTAGNATDTNDKVVTLDSDIVLTNTGVAANSAAITVPAGVTLDGDGHTISVGEQWSGDTKTHILSVENAAQNTTTTIKNLTIVGNENTKSGIHAYNCSGTVKLDTVTIQNCGNAAVQVNGSKVEATNLTTEGNAWGAVNVDKGTAVTNKAEFNLESGDLREPNKIWTELKSSSGDTNVTITVPDGWAAAMPSYDGKTYYVTNDTVSFKIGNTPYATLRDAVLAAASATETTDKTITLCADVTVANQNIESIGANEAVVTLPDGWTLDGQGYTITAATDWAKKKNNHILGVTAATTGVTIKDVTIVGNENTKHGINAWTATTPEGAQAGKLTLTDVTIKDCGTAGMVVQNTEVTATGLTTSGNAWGAVNVDSKGSPKLNLANANLGEDIQVWTELTNVPIDTITIDGNAFVQVKGEGESTDESGLKGFTYYTTDPSKLGEASILENGVITVYTTFESALSAAQTVDKKQIKLLKDVEVESLISITSAGLTIDGNGKTIKYVQSDESANGTMITVQQNANDVTIKNLTVDTNGKTKHGIQFYCVENGKLDGVTVEGGTYTSVMVNGAQVAMTDCTLNPAESAYANIEYGMGSNVTTQPKITLADVTGSPKKPLVYADKTTADKFKGEDDDKSYAEIANEINKNLSGAGVSIVITKEDGTVDEENSVVGTQIYTITLDVNGGNTVTPNQILTTNEGILSATLPVPTHSNNRYNFNYWAMDDGTKVTEDTVFTEDAVLKAQWTKTGGGSSGGGGSNSSSSSSGSRYSVSVSSTANGEVTVSPKSASKGKTVTITVKPDASYELDELTVTDKDGDEISVKRKSDTKYTFTMPSGKVTVKATFAKVSEQPEPGSMAFTDVASSAYYYDAVKWAVEQGITSGITATTFGPDASCTRAQMVSFLWRANGSPKAAGANPFTDVSADAYYYDAVLWAVEKGITSGTSATTFSPNATVTRGQTVTFLHRANGSPAVSGSNPFTDVAADAYYAAAVQWAVAENVTAGTSATTFASDAPCTRGQIVTFLYRDMA